MRFVNWHMLRSIFTHVVVIGGLPPHGGPLSPRGVLGALGGGDGGPHVGWFGSHGLALMFGRIRNYLHNRVKLATLSP